MVAALMAVTSVGSMDSFAQEAEVPIEFAFGVTADSESIEIVEIVVVATTTATTTTEVVLVDQIIEPTGSISGMKFSDVNNNGKQDEDEPGLSGWTITLSGESLDGSISTTTDENGEYVFESLSEDDYVVCENGQEGWTQTYPIQGATCESGIGYDVTISFERQQITVSGINFGNYREEVVVEEEVVPVEVEKSSVRGRSGGRRQPPSNNQEGQVLGVSTSNAEIPPSCEPYIKSYIKLGKPNDVEDVKRLQSFLNEYLKTNLPVTGFYGPMSFEAVKKFQVAEKEFVYTPWVEAGYKFEAPFPTGYVFKTTQWRINNLKCEAAGNTFSLPVL